MVMEVKGLLSLEEAAAYLSIGRTKFLEMVYSNEIASIPIGRRRLVARAELDRFITQLQEQARA